MPGKYRDLRQSLLSPEARARAEAKTRRLLHEIERGRWTDWLVIWTADHPVAFALIVMALLFAIPAIGLLL